MAAPYPMNIPTEETLEQLYRDLIELDHLHEELYCAALTGNADRVTLLREILAMVSRLSNQSRLALGLPTKREGLQASKEWGGH